MNLNERAARLCHSLPPRVREQRLAGARLLDAGIAAPGGLEAGLWLARLCLADAAQVSWTRGEVGLGVLVASDEPVAACMAAQYAGWQVSVGNYFAMGSGPMRAAYGKETLFDTIGLRESPGVAVGVLETRKLPPAEVVAYLAERTRVAPEALTLAIAPACSLAGTIQVVARSLETALHKLHELKFDLAQVISGVGYAPLPPVGQDDLQAIGWTNDAILYGGVVDLWVRAEEDLLSTVGPQVPASSSPLYGAPFAEIFRAAGGDFYQIDPMLFSPAVVRFMNLSTGRRHCFGRLAPEVLARSFGQ
ncbi:MAG: methenyltetrahydromethanopterin cyclohydrolase [Gemmataceae bacterium]